MWHLIGSINWQRKLLIFAGATLIFAVTGPFGTYEDLSFGWRLIYWVAALIGCGLFFHLIIDALMRMTLLAATPRILRLVCGALVAAVPSTVLVMALESLIRGAPIDGNKLVLLWLSVVLVGIAIGFVNFMPPFVRTEKRPGGMEFDPSTVPFLARIPVDIGTRLITLSMRDHYVNAVTEKGSTMILMKFTDALGELQNYPGIRIHRSHWVALDAIAEFKKRNRNSVVVMNDGQALPVSNTYRNSLDITFSKLAVAD